MAKGATLHWRGFVAFLTLLGFLLMGLTGLVLYVTPQGRVAYWTDWTLLGLTKTHWGSIHILSSVLFLAAGGFHIYFNWKPLVHYVLDKARRGLRLRTEMAASLARAVVIVLFAIFEIPPLSYILDLNAMAKDAWVASQDYEPPFGHAEDVPLRVLAKKVDMDLEQALGELRRKGVKVESASKTLLEISQANSTTPMDLYVMIKKFERKEVFPEGAVWTADMVDEKFAGTGLGRKTLDQAARDAGLDPALAAERLEKKGIPVESGETLKQAAERHGLKPIDFVKALLVQEDAATP
jgi:hypothetical protein